MRTSLIAILTLLAATGISPPTLADASDADLQALHAQLVEFNDRLDRLERANQELRQENARLRQSAEQTTAAVAAVNEKATAVAEQLSASASTSSWTDRIALKGDFRLRQESIDEQGKDTRNRTRVRARAAIVAAVNDDFEVGLGFASGGDDPVSTNQTLGGGGSTKDINMDLAYVQYAGLENTRLIGGKFKNILYKPGGHALLWDGDWNPEGLGLAWASGDYFVNAIGTWLESDSKNETEFSYGLQAGLKKPLGDRVTLTAGIGYYAIGTRGKGSFFGADDDFFGNSFDPVSKAYLYDYEELELFADIGLELGGRPAGVFLDYVQNQDAPAFDTGYAAGFRYGKASGPGSWELGYAWQDLEADAAFGLLVDSDFGGGGTDVRGHVFKGGYAIARNIKASFTYFLNDMQANVGNEHDYDRLQLDLALKY
jgi:hypothetical protein